MQDDAQKRLVHREGAVIRDEAEALEFPHEEIDIRARDAGEFGELVPRHLRQQPLRLVVLHPVTREQQGGRVRAASRGD